jgi:hypothetical protein
MFCSYLVEGKNTWEYQTAIKRKMTSIESAASLGQSLAYVSPFGARRASEKHQAVMMREILSSGEVSYPQTTLRKLLVTVNAIANAIDRKLHLPISVNKTNESSREKKNHESSSAAIPLRIRDLRHLDFLFSTSEEPSIWVRKHAVLISIDPIRAVVMADRVVIIIPPGGFDSVLSVLERYVTDWKRVKAHLMRRDYDSPGTTQSPWPENNSDAAVVSTSQKSFIYAPSMETKHGFDGYSEVLSDGTPVNTGLTFEMHVYEAILVTVRSLYVEEIDGMKAEARDVLRYFKAGKGTLLPYHTQVTLHMNDACLCSMY